MSCYVLHCCWMVGRHCHIHSLTFLRNERQTASRRLANRYARRYIERTIGTASCQAIPIVYRYLERRPVTPSRSEGSLAGSSADPSLREGVTARTPLTSAHGRPSLQMSKSSRE